MMVCRGECKVTARTPLGWNELRQSHELWPWRDWFWWEGFFAHVWRYATTPTFGSDGAI